MMGQLQFSHACGRFLRNSELNERSYGSFTRYELAVTLEQVWEVENRRRAQAHNSNVSDDSRFEFIGERAEAFDSSIKR